MTPQQDVPILRGRRRRRRARPLAQALAARGPLAYPGYREPDEAVRTRSFLTGSALLHAVALGALVLVAGLSPVIEEVIIPVQLLPEPPPREAALEPAPAPKALALRRNLPYAPAVQAVAPQIVNPAIVAEARPVLEARALEMEAVGASTAPTRVEHRAAVVERVSAVNAAVRARVAAVDVAALDGPAVRGPTRVEAAAGPSVGPRRVEGATSGTIGTAPLPIGHGNGSSVRDGLISDRDVVGAPEGALVVSIDTSLGEGELAGPGGTGHGAGGTGPDPSCTQRPAVSSYMDLVKQRTIERWLLPPGIEAGLEVTLRFELDAAGAASKVSIVRAQDHALGASAVDALRSASPFPPMPDDVRCLASRPLRGTFSNPVGG